jgi:hypothetical protein
VTASLSKVTADVQIGRVVGCDCQVAGLELRCPKMLAIADWFLG